MSTKISILHAFRLWRKKLKKVVLQKLQKAEYEGMVCDKGLEKLDDFLLDCGYISQEEREVIMEFVNSDEFYKKMENY